MKFRTEIKPEESEFRIRYDNSLFFIGSCFSEEIGSYLKRGKFDILINPNGVLYNPVSVADCLNRIIGGSPFTSEELCRYNDRYLSFSHDTSFTTGSVQETLGKLNTRLELAARKLKNASYLFVTFGTARIYRLNSSGAVVSNCHKLPANEFSREVLEVDAIVKLWKDTIDNLRSFNKDLNIIFTVSPVRHWKDGAHGNQLSKSILFVALEKLLSTEKKLGYFPSYELVMDDLRDYRYYKSDMLHPSPEAVKYIWEYFLSAYFENQTLAIYSEIDKIIDGREHRITGDNIRERRIFGDKMIRRIEVLNGKYPDIDLEEEKEYFKKL